MIEDNFAGAGAVLVHTASQVQIVLKAPAISEFWCMISGCQQYFSTLSPKSELQLID